MSRAQRHIKSQLNTINEVSNAIIQKPTNAAFVSKKLWKLIRKKGIYDKRVKLYMLNQHWLKIRKQKDRRRRKVLTKLWKIRQLALLKRMYGVKI